jgi:hypothetical protein
LPNTGKRLHRFELDPLGRVCDGLFVWPSSCGNAAAEVVEVSFRSTDTEGSHLVLIRRRHDELVCCIGLIHGSVPHFCGWAKTSVRRGMDGDSKVTIGFVTDLPT